MPGRLIFFIFILAIILFFIGFNLGDEYRCDINFGFAVLPRVPVFFTIFVSFALGLLCSLPFIIKSRIGRKRNDTIKDIKPSKNDSSGSDDIPYINGIEPDEKIKQEAMSARERFFAKRSGKK
jgi:hypothetical protein